MTRIWVPISCNYNKVVRWRPRVIRNVFNSWNTQVVNQCLATERTVSYGHDQMIFNDRFAFQGSCIDRVVTISYALHVKDWPMLNAACIVSYVFPKWPFSL